MDDLKKTNPQQMLEDAFRAIYENDSKNEQARVEGEVNLNEYQIEWCNKFKETFAFVSQYGGRINIHMVDDFDVKFFHKDKCCVSVVSESGGYYLEVHPPMPNTEICHCLENYIYDTSGNKQLSLTLTEITTHISKGLAKSNADNKQLESE